MQHFEFTAADFEQVRLLALEYPNASDSLSHYDTPSVKIKKHLLCRLNENGEWIVIRTDFASRDLFLEQYPESCFITSHYEKYPYICLHTGKHNPSLIKQLLDSGYRAITVKKKKS
jgi:hypothetical protein